MQCISRYTELYHARSGCKAFIALNPQALCALVLQCNKCPTSLAPVIYVTIA